VLQGGQERDSGVVAAHSEAGKGCGKESVILLLLKKLGNKLLYKEGKGRKKERSWQWLLLRISITHTVSLHITSSHIPVSTKAPGLANTRYETGVIMHHWSYGRIVIS